jgi:hypothetical protein
MIFKLSFLVLVVYLMILHFYYVVILLHFLVKIFYDTIFIFCYLVRYVIPFVPFCSLPLVFFIFFLKM